MRNEQFEVLLKKACQNIIEAEYEESQKQKIQQHKFSERHERIMKQMFKDMRNGIEIQQKYGKKLRRGKLSM